MTTHDENERQELVDFLKEHGWDEKKANRFLDDKVGLRVLQIPGMRLLDVIQELCQEGIPVGTVSVGFLVPAGNWDAFKERAEKVVAKRGGLVLTLEQQAMLSRTTH